MWGWTMLICTTEKYLSAILDRDGQYWFALKPPILRGKYLYCNIEVWNGLHMCKQYELRKPGERQFQDKLTQRGCCADQYCAYPHLPLLSILSRWNHIIVQGGAWLVFFKLWTDPLRNLKCYARRRFSLKRPFNWYIAIPTLEFVRHSL